MAMQKEILDLCERVSHVTYENLTKIIRYSQAKSADAARKLDDSYENDLDAWMGGGTCFSLTWHLYQELLRMGYKPKLLMGDKRIEKNVHCALLLPLSLRTRRLHDIGMSGWWQLLLFVPYLGELALFICTLLPGTEGENRFGEQPR